MTQTILWRLLDIIKASQQKQNEIDGKYNVFYALRIWHKEVTLHSRILTDLLRVDGYHGLKAKPLQAFIDMLPIEAKFQCDDKVEVTDEKAAGDMRRIDIFLKDANGQVIIIENKIYACDQTNQIVDYHKFGCKQCEKPVVLYLTLNGTTPSKASCGELKEEVDYFCVSYSELIKNWIERCIGMADKVGNSALVEVLRQYNQVIEYLVKQNIENIAQLLGNINTEEDFKAITELATTIGSIPSTVRQVFLEKLEQELVSKFTGLYKNSSCIWYKLDQQVNPGQTDGLRDWFSIKDSNGRLWCSLTACKDDCYGDYIHEEPDRKERFAKVYENVKIKAECNNKDYWFWLDDVVDLNFEEYATIKDVLNAQTPKVVQAAAKKITKLFIAYNELITKH